ARPDWLLPHRMIRRIYAPIPTTSRGRRGWTRRPGDGRSRVWLLGIRRSRGLGVAEFGYVGVLVRHLVGDIGILGERQLDLRRVQRRLDLRRVQLERVVVRH